MWIKMLINLGADHPEPWKDREEHECSADYGKKLVDANMAVEIPSPVKAEPIKEGFQGTKPILIKDPEVKTEPSKPSFPPPKPTKPEVKK